MCEPSRLRTLQTKLFFAANVMSSSLVPPVDLPLRLSLSIKIIKDVRFHPAGGD